MAWCMISTLIGAVIFGAGMVFERLLSADMPETETGNESADMQDTLSEKEHMRIFGQWKNLLDYDGTKQEETEYEDM